MSLQRDLTDRCFTLSYAGNRNWFLKPTTPTTETDARQPIALQAMPPNPHKAALLANFIGRRSATKNVEESGHHFYCRQYCRIAQPIRFHDLHPLRTYSITGSDSPKRRPVTREQANPLPLLP